MLCRLFLDRELHVGSSIALPDDLGHYLRNVMRLAAGDPVVLFNGCGGEFRCQIEQLARRDAAVYIESFSDVSREMGCRAHIVQAACRSEKIETVLQKGTETGAAAFTIVRSERSSLKLDGAKLQKRLQRWQKIVIEAAEQSGRTRIPPLRWHNHLADIRPDGASFALHPETTTSWPEQRERIRRADDVTLAVGPEGGWSRRDIDTLTDNGFETLCFGPRVMRTETAAPALLAAIQAIRND